MNPYDINNPRVRRKLNGILKGKSGYQFRQNGLLMQAFTRKSFDRDVNEEDCEVLELLGDSILKQYVLQILIKRLESRTPAGNIFVSCSVRDLSEMCQDLVCNQNLSRIAEDWGLTPYIRMSKQENLKENPKIGADLIEAFLGAIAFDCKNDPNVLEQVVRTVLDIDGYLDRQIEQLHTGTPFTLDTAVTFLKEYAEKKHCSDPEYTFGKPEDLGKDDDGNPIWCCTCTVLSFDFPRITVWGKSKKECKAMASYIHLLNRFRLPNPYGDLHSTGISYYFDGKTCRPGYQNVSY